MTLNEALLPEFDREMANTRKTLERVPEERFDWKPHQKSMPMGRLAQHLSQLPSWAVETIERESLDLAPPGAPPYQPRIMNSRREILEAFDKNVAAARVAITGAKEIGRAHV